MEGQTMTIAEANAANARPITNGSGATPATTKTATKTPATKRSAGKSLASQVKTATTKTSAPRAAVAVKTTKTATRASNGPTDRSMKRDVIAYTLKTAVDAFLKLPTKTVNKVKCVTINGQDIPRDVALYAVKQTFGYIPPDLWDSRLGPRDVGRPVGSGAVTDVSKTVATTKRSATKTSAPATTKTATTKTATPATKRSATKTATAA